MAKIELLDTEEKILTNILSLVKQGFRGGQISSELVKIAPVDLDILAQLLNSPELDGRVAA